MRQDTINLLCNPYKGEPFKLGDNQIIGVTSGQTFQIREGIPVILPKSVITGRNKTYKLLYDLVAVLYDSILALGESLKINKEIIVRQEYIAQLPFQPGQRVLETSAGTCTNLAYLPDSIDYFALDISYQMLKRGETKAAKAEKNLECIQADGAHIPFRDDTFDLVFNMGGIQFYSDPFQGIAQMARVAKPGSTIHVIDEIGGAIRTLKPHPAHTKYSVSKEKAIEGMKRLVPHSMKNVSSRVIPNTDFYALTFTKPKFTFATEFI